MPSRQPPADGADLQRIGAAETVYGSLSLSISQHTVPDRAAPRMRGAPNFAERQEREGAPFFI